MSKPVKLRTIGGKTVTWTPTRKPPWGDYTCEGCGLTHLGARLSHADDHAAACRVI